MICTDLSIRSHSLLARSPHGSSQGGLHSLSVLPFIAMQILGAAVAVPLMRVIHQAASDGQHDAN